MSKNLKRIIWAIWLVMMLVAVYFFFDRAIFTVQDQPLAILAFLSLILIASLFPIRFRTTNIVPLHGIALAVFLQFGLLIEIFVIQLAIFTSLMSLRLPRTELYRYPLNSIIFLTVSVTSASIYYMLGGTTGNFSEVQLTSVLLPILIYASIYFLLNNWMIFMIRKHLVKVKGARFFDEALKWEAVSAVLVIPIGITLVLLFQQIGLLAVFLIGIPLLSLSLILKLYNQSEVTTRLLKKVSSFGYQVNENLPVKSIIELFTKTVTSIFPVDQALVYEVHEGKLKVVQAFHAGKTTSLNLKNGDGISRKVLESGKSVDYSTSKQWDVLVDNNLWQGVNSVMSVPAINNNEVKGVITLGSSKKRAFENSNLMLLEIMANYLAVAIQNAKNYEEKKNESERCSLTNLFNFRYFENLLFEKYDIPASDEDFAIILLDLDHFKQINDAFGHQSGNEVLCQVAKVLETTLGDYGTLARYGGEEFVVLLEGTDVEFAKKIAEALRYEIENHLFVVSEDLKSRERKSVRITASIGVAAKSEPEESAMSVLRNADRAMYTGAKQQGRNRVSHF